MTADEFQTAATALLRSAVGWQSAIAHRLGIDRRTVSRWLHAGATPDWVDGRMAELMGGLSASPWPRDEWLIGDGVTDDGRRREYIVHLVAPRFVARIVAVDDDGLAEPEEMPADILSGIVYVADRETLLCEIEWIDEVDPGTVTHLLEAAADAIERQGLSDSR
jgi:hypothetical protein